MTKVLRIVTYVLAEDTLPLDEARAITHAGIAGRARRRMLPVANSAELVGEHVEDALATFGAFR